ncbi:MAG: PilZ domain-containing protein [Desulfobacterales bacterium]|nr:PilZ domain-containing protein [Desulfobacterales bacterium]
MFEPKTELKKSISDEKLMRAIKTARLFKLISDMPPKEQDILLEELEKRKVSPKRKFPRKECSIPLNYGDGKRVYSDMVKSICANGLFIETKETFVVGQEVTLILTLPNHPRPIKLNGEVTRASKKGVGVSFKKLTPYMEEMLKVIVEKI